MNDRYLYRAKRTDNGEWLTGSYVYTFTEDKDCYCAGIYKENHWIVEENGNMVSVDTSTICQCTGLKDKHGKLIFENDIVRCGKNCTVTWCDVFASWRLNTIGWMYSHFFGESCRPEDVEVIGNIFDNPELLEK